MSAVELRWYNDYQKPCPTAVLNKAIRWHQTLAKHDHFWMDLLAVDKCPAIIATDVSRAVQPGTPATKSRSCAVVASQIV